MSDAPHHPYRVTRTFEGGPLTAKQQRALTALVALCPDPGCDVSAREIAKVVGLPVGPLTVILESLRQKRLVFKHEADDAAPEGWTPTLTGRSRVRHFPSELGERSPESAEAD